MKKILLVLIVMLCTLMSCDTAEFVTYGGGYDYNYYYGNYPVVIVGGQYYYRYYLGGQYFYEPVPRYHYNRIIGYRTYPKHYAPKRSIHPNRSIRSGQTSRPKGHTVAPRQNVRQTPNNSMRQNRGSAVRRR